MRTVGVEVWVPCRAGRGVMPGMSISEPSVRKPGIEAHANLSDDSIQPWPPQRQRPVDRIMRHDENADIEPRLHGDQKRRRQPARAREMKEENTIDMQYRPHGDDQSRQSQSNESLMRFRVGYRLVH